MENKHKLINDEIDFISILSVFFDNLNFIFSIFLASLLVVFIYYFSVTKFYESSSLLEIKDDNSSFLPTSLSSGLGSSITGNDSLDAEMEIYKSNETIIGALENLKKVEEFNNYDIPSPNFIRSNLSLVSNSKNLMNISLTLDDRKLSSSLLDLLNIEYINDRKNFIKQSSAAGILFIKEEIPRIKALLKDAEDNLNNFKISTNTSDVIFDTNNRNLKLERLKNRINEIAFKELELKEFYKENHPIYLTLSQQKKLIESQINEIESDLPNIPTTQRALENFKREVEIYSNVLRELSSQEITLAMTEASSLSNVRIINQASESIKISPSPIVFISTVLMPIIAYLILLVRHFLGNRITHLDALSDYVGKEKIIGELPFLDIEGSSSNDLPKNIADELLNKTIYEITHSTDHAKKISIVSSIKDAGKTEISKRLFEKLRLKYKVCLLDLDYRKKGLTKEIKDDKNFKSFNEFENNLSEYIYENESLFIPSLEVDSPPDFFTSQEFKDKIEQLSLDFDYVICDTPPWKLFIDGKIISNSFDKHIYVVCNQKSSFRDIELFYKDFENKNSIFFFYNKFKLYFNFFWYQYQYPYYSRHDYYDYLDYASFKKDTSFLNILRDIPLNSILLLEKYIKK